MSVEFPPMGGNKRRETVSKGNGFDSLDAVTGIKREESDPNIGAGKVLEEIEPIGIKSAADIDIDKARSISMDMYSIKAEIAKKYPDHVAEFQPLFDHARKIVDDNQGFQSAVKPKEQEKLFSVTRQIDERLAELQGLPKTRHEVSASQPAEPEEVRASEPMPEALSLAPLVKETGEQSATRRGVRGGRKAKEEKKDAEPAAEAVGKLSSEFIKTNNALIQKNIDFITQEIEEINEDIIAFGTSPEAEELLSFLNGNLLFFQESLAITTEDEYESFQVKLNACNIERKELIAKYNKYTHSFAPGENSPPREETVTLLVNPEGEVKAPETPAENRKAQAEAIAEIGRIQEAEQKTLIAEQKYKEHTTKFYSKKNALFRFGFKEMEESKRAYDRSLLELARTRRGEEKLDGKTLLQKVIRHGEEAKMAARREALDAAGKTALDKGIEMFMQGNKKLEEFVGGKEQAKLVRVLGAVSLVTLVASAAGAFATTGLVGAAGFGAWKVGRSLMSTYGGALAAKAGAEFAEKKIFKVGQEKAKTQLENAQLNDNFSAAAFREAQKNVRELIAKSSDQSVMKKKILTQLVLGVAAGATTAEFVSELAGEGLFDKLFHLGNYAQAPVPHGTSAPPETVKPGPGKVVPTEKPGTVNQHPGGGHKDAPVAGPKPEDQQAPKHVPPSEPVGGMLENASVQTNGEGMDGLFVSLKGQMHGFNYDPSKCSALANHLMNSHPSALSHEIHAALGEKATGTSFQLHKGDQLFLDDKDNMWFQAKGSDHPQLLMENDPTSKTGYTVHKIEGKLIPNEHHIAPHEAHPAGIHQENGDAETARLNQTQVTGEHITAGPHDVLTHGGQVPLRGVEELTLEKHVPQDLHYSPENHTPTLRELARDIPPPPHTPSLRELAHDIQPANHTGSIHDTLHDGIKPSADHIVVEPPVSIDINQHGVNISTPALVADKDGHLFAHIARGDDPFKNSEMAYNDAVKYAMANPNKPIYYIHEEREGILGLIKKEVTAIKYKPGSGASGPMPYVSIGADAVEMPSIPGVNDLYVPKK